MLVFQRHCLFPYQPFLADSNKSTAIFKSFLFVTIKPLSSARLISFLYRSCKLDCPAGVDCSSLPVSVKWFAVTRRGPVRRYAFRLIYDVDVSSIFNVNRVDFRYTKGNKIYWRFFLGFLKWNITFTFNYFYGRIIYSHQYITIP